MIQPKVFRGFLIVSLLYTLLDEKLFRRKFFSVRSQDKKLAGKNVSEITYFVSSGTQSLNSA